MKILQTKLLILFFCLFTLPAFSQLRLPVTNNDLRTNLQKVIADFSQELKSVRGEVRSENPQTIEYATVLKFEGSEDNFVTKYISKKPIYSWEASLLTTEDYDEAVKKYKWLYGQLKVMTVNLNDGYSFTFDGKYGAPDPNKKFAASTFRMIPAAINLPKLKVEANLQYYFPEWKVILTVYQKEREDIERGEQDDD